jgi:DNA-binding transcriptional regulator YhcF (GntR family)
MSDTVSGDAVTGGDVRGNEVSKQHKAGRKPVTESRATELRQALVTWEQTPESMRPSLRALAKELNTSHQLLQHYLEGLEEWQCRERYRVAKATVDKKAEGILSRAKAENRELTLREYGDAFVVPGFVGKIEELRQEAKRGPLHSGWFKLLEMFAKRGAPEMQELAQELWQGVRRSAQRRRRLSRPSYRQLRG